MAPWFYPGSNFTATFANGATKTVQCYAAIPSDLEPKWAEVTDGESFYKEFVHVDTEIAPSNGDEADVAVGKRSIIHQKSVQKDTVPPNYPMPVIQHDDKEVELGAFFLNDVGLHEVAVLSMNTFEPVASGDSTEFQGLINKFLAYAKSNGRSKIIVDVSSNGGGSLFLGYDTFKQFFPKQEPNIGARYRYSEGLDIMGTAFGHITLQQAESNLYQSSGFSAGDMYLSPLHYTNSIDVDGNDFTSWDDMKGPVTINGASYTQIMRYNFSDPFFYEGDNIKSVYGYGEFADYTTQPYAAQDIILLHDGYCASTCAVFTDLMRRQGGVRSIALGGRPQLGPMQSVGGTKGVLMEPWSAIAASIGGVLNNFGTEEQKEEWAQILPSNWPIQFTNPPSINFRSGYHPGSDTPMQFLNESANCRLFYTPDMLRNVTNVWDAVARLAWGLPGGTGQTCVHGSESDGSPIGESKGTVGKTVSEPITGSDAVESGSGSGSIDGSGEAWADDSTGGQGGASPQQGGAVARGVSWGLLGAVAVVSAVVMQI